MVYAAQGLGGYDSALQLGLKSLVSDQPATGEISIATTGVGDPAAFARVQAGTLAPDKALDEAYRRNNAGSYAEAAEFFAAASNASNNAPLGQADALVNEALQKSNLGRYAEADSLFDKAAALVGPGPDRRSPAAQFTKPFISSTRATPRLPYPSSDKPLPKRDRGAGCRDRRQRPQHRRT